MNIGKSTVDRARNIYREKTANIEKQKPGRKPKYHINEAELSTTPEIVEETSPEPKQRGRPKKLEVIDDEKEKRPVGRPVTETQFTIPSHS